MKNEDEKKFYKKSYQERLEELLYASNLSKKNANIINKFFNTDDQKIVENYLFSLPVPVGILRKIIINGEEYIVPMATEEPSVIAAANNGAKILGNIESTTNGNLISGQIFLQSENIENFIQNNKQQLIEIGNRSIANMVERGGGIVNLEYQDHVIDISVDTVDSMGANSVNTSLEVIKSELEKNGIKVIAAIVSNYTDQSIVSARAEVPLDKIGGSIAEKIVALSLIAQKNIKRATTENKGILNGVDAVVAATGNDVRAVEAAVHAYASRNGHYQGLSTWHILADKLIGQVFLPIKVGIVGGTVLSRPTAKLNLDIINIKSSKELAQVIGAVGLAQNFAALRAIVDQGIQLGHMKMQKRATDEN